MPPARPGALSAQADLRPSQVQDLADQVGEVARAAVGYDLRFSLRIDLAGATTPPAELVERLNKLLAEVADGLRFK